jgi:hypothetical protein
MLITPVTIAMCGPRLFGTSETTLLPIASIIFVPLMIPVRTPAAQITDATASAFAAWSAEPPLLLVHRRIVDDEGNGVGDHEQHRQRQHAGNERDEQRDRQARR